MRSPDPGRHLVDLSEQPNIEIQVMPTQLDDGSGRVAVRHSHHPEGSVIVYTRAEWDAFLSGAKDGEFDFTA